MAESPLYAGSASASNYLNGLNSSLGLGSDLFSLGADALDPIGGLFSSLLGSGGGGGQGGTGGSAPNVVNNQTANTGGLSNVLQVGSTIGGAGGGGGGGGGGGLFSLFGGGAGGAGGSGGDVAQNITQANKTYLSLPDFAAGANPTPLPSTQLPSFNPAALPSTSLGGGSMLPPGPTPSQMLGMPQTSAVQGLSPLLAGGLPSQQGAPGAPPMGGGGDNASAFGGQGSSIPFPPRFMVNAVTGGDSGLVPPPPPDVTPQALMQSAIASGNAPTADTTTPQSTPETSLPPMPDFSETPDPAKAFTKYADAFVGALPGHAAKVKAIYSNARQEEEGIRADYEGTPNSKGKVQDLDDYIKGLRHEGRAVRERLHILENADLERKNAQTEEFATRVANAHMSDPNIATRFRRPQTTRPTALGRFADRLVDEGRATQRTGNIYLGASHMGRSWQQEWDEAHDQAAKEMRAEMDPKAWDAKLHSIQADESEARLEKGQMLSEMHKSIADIYKRAGGELGALREEGRGFNVARQMSTAAVAGLIKTNENNALNENRKANLGIAERKTKVAESAEKRQVNIAPTLKEEMKAKTDYYKKGPSNPFSTGGDRDTYKANYLKKHPSASEKDVEAVLDDMGL